MTVFVFLFFLFLFFFLFSGGMIFTSADVFLACATVIKAGQYVSVNHLSFPIPPSISLGLGGSSTLHTGT